MTPEEVVEFAEGLARIAASGGGPRALAAHLAAATGGGVLVEDACWRHIAAVGSSEMPPSARAVVQSSAPGRVRQIFNGAAQLGWLSLFGCDVQEADYLLRLTASAIGVELSRDASTGGNRRRGFWERVLGRDHHDTNGIRDDAAAHGVTVAPAYLTIALECESLEQGQADAAEDARAMANEVFRSAGADLGLLERAGTLYVFVPALREVDASNARTAAKLLPKTLSKRSRPLRVSGGVGRVEALADLAAGARSAETALAIGRRVHGDGHVAVYEELGAYPLLYEGAVAESLAAFATSVLAPLRAYDEKHQTELERTLVLYFSVGENVKTAAARLNVHRHTVFYRLRQIGEICGYSLESPHDQLTLRMAVSIDALHS